MIWVKHIAFWQILYQMWRIVLDATVYVFTLDMEDVSIITCKSFRFLEMSFAFNACLTGFCVHVDGTLLITFPTWYSRQNWNTIIPKSSACIAFMTFLCCSPSIFVFDIREGSCEIVSQTGLFLMWILFFFSYFILLFALNISFIVGLHRYRMKKKETNQTKVEFSASKEENEEVPFTGKQNISINTVLTEKFNFSADDTKAVKYMMFSTTIVLIFPLFIASGFYGVKLVNENLGTNINFWAYFELYLVYTFGLQFIILFLSKDKLRNCLRERWSGFFRKR